MTPFFAQGDPSNNVLYIQEGGVKLTVVNQSGKQAVVAILGPGDFCGEGCLVGQSISLVTATAIAPTIVLAIEKNEMVRALHVEHDFSDRFITFMLARNIRIENDLVDQLRPAINGSRALLLARLATEHASDPQKDNSGLSQEMLAETVGTTRSRVNFFMNKFRNLGLIHYKNGEIHVNNSLLSIVLHD